MKAKFGEISFTDNDVVWPGRYMRPDSESNEEIPQRVPWLLHDRGVTLCVVFAENAEKAIEEAAVAGKLDQFSLGIDSPDIYFTSRDAVKMGQRYGWDESKVQFIGSLDWPYDLEYVDILQLPNPKFSFVALFSHSQLEQP